MDGAAKRVLLTGSRGFTGQYLRAELERSGYSVFGLTDTGPSTDTEIVADLRDARAVRETVAAIAPDAVVHLGAISFAAHDNTEDIYQVNVMGSVHLLEALAQLPSRPSRVLLASSANIYGNAGDEPIAESRSPAPINHYGSSKLAMEAVAEAYRTRLPILVTRPFNYTGSGQNLRFLVPKLVDHFRRRLPTVELGNLDVERDFLDVRTVAYVYRRLLEVDPGEATVVNICSGQPIRLRSILDLLQAITRHPIEVVVNPEFLRGNEIRRLLGDATRLSSIVGALPALTFETTLRDMLNAPGGET